MTSAIDHSEFLRGHSEVVSRDDRPVHEGSGEDSFSQETASRSANRVRENLAPDRLPHAPREFVVFENGNLSEVAGAPCRFTLKPLSLVTPGFSQHPTPEIDQERGDPKTERGFLERKLETAESRSSP